MRTPRPSGTASALAAATVALVLGAGACGGSGTPPASAVTPSTVPSTVNTDNPISRARTVVDAQNRQLQQEQDQTGG